MKRIYKFFRDNLQKIVTAVTFVVVLLVYFCVKDPISIMALVVATVAAVANLLTLQRSRDTVRPFLSHNANVIDAAELETGEHIRIAFRSHNSGSLPATEVKVRIDFFASDEEVAEDNYSGTYPSTKKPNLIPMILSPNHDYRAEHVLDLRDEGDLRVWSDVKNGNVKFRLKISYESLNRKHLTVQSGKIGGYSWEKGVTFEPIRPQKWS